jgi:hypothetical protein
VIHLFEWQLFVADSCGSFFVKSGVSLSLSYPRSMEQANRTIVDALEEYSTIDRLTAIAGAMPIDCHDRIIGDAVHRE